MSNNTNDSLTKKNNFLYPDAGSGEDILWKHIVTKGVPLSQLQAATLLAMSADSTAADYRTRLQFMQTADARGKMC